MSGISVNKEEIEFLINLLNKYPLESIRSIAKKENISYPKLKKLFDKYYGPSKSVHMVASISIAKLGLMSYVAFLSVPRENIKSTIAKMYRNSFIPVAVPFFGFINGVSTVMYVPLEQRDKIDELLSRYSPNYEYYEVYAYPSKKLEFGKWEFSYDYALLLDILKRDARTPMKEIEEALGKKRPTIRYMINRLKELGILRGFMTVVNEEAYNRGFCGIARSLSKEFLDKFKEHEIMIGVIKPEGYLIEWYFSSEEDIYQKILEFSKYVDRFGIYYFDMFDFGIRGFSFSKAVKKDRKGYHSILDFD
ncbi:MAG: hypothetical protein PWQ32_632 [Thermococcaceae archaeon]|nr:hypothetical protein [Thermococcaceae archaeon]